ncbi:uncharacterized protein LOC131437489 [Malaya genurostris]|uniref:uncharacterized protein LOC131437489 n=1 Tax=Malaya genurostris TaxID=325434 RepID=UPI0026F38E75|nr:uncharacterized protein LOC131437489 [Malaya genurostris]
MKTLTDATCIRVLTSRKLLIGIGNTLVLYYGDADGITRTKLAPLPRFKSKIHGIDFCATESSWLIALHAGREAFSVSLNQNNEFYDLTPIKLYNSSHKVLYYPEDRVMLLHSANRFIDWISLLKLFDRRTVCVITGHGVAILINRDYSGMWSPVDYCPCEDSSTLYCSQIVGSSWSNSLIFSGTALGLLVIWRPSGARKGEVLSSSRAHNGVIFSIECDLDIGFLTTTSDDRSVKFWTIQLLPNDGNVMLKENGYCFGHTARAFQCRIIRDVNSSMVASIGEDSTLCLWDSAGNLLVKKMLENGATLWNLDYCAERKIIYVCASNGNVSQLDMKEHLLSCQREEKIHHIAVDTGGERLAKVKFLSNGSLLGVTDHNKVVLLVDGSPCQVVDQISDFKCSILDTLNELVFVAGNRHLNIYKVNGASIELARSVIVNFDRNEFLPEREPITFSIIRSLHFCWNKNVVLCDNNGRCLVYNREADELQSCHRVPKTSERWLTCAFGIEEYLLLADRAGNLFLYRGKNVDPLYKLPHLHGHFGITGIRLEESTADGYFLLTSGHDGHVRSILVEPNECTLKVYGCEKIPISWIDRTSQCLNGLCFMGFNSSRFVLCDGHDHAVLFQADCGGGHRYWDCYLSNDGTGSFVFIQHKQLTEIRFQLPEPKSNSLQVQRLNWHTKICNVVRVVRTEHTTLFVSGGEDNILRINTLCRETGNLLNHSRNHLTSHISSIKTICCSWKLAVPEGKILIISAGGRAQLCLTTLDTVTLRTKDELSYMLLASDSERSRWKPNPIASDEPETRFMCMTLVESTASLYVGCSDGALRQFSLSASNGCYQLELKEEIYYGKCFLHITHLTVKDIPLIVTMTTDGFVSFWDTRNISKPFDKVRYQSSGINAFDVRSLKDDGRFLIATGGDDQDVNVCKVQIVPTKRNGFVLQSSYIKQQCAHLGQVTGLRFMDENTLWSVGTDQVIILWHLSSKSISAGKSLQSCVADIKGLDLVPETNEIFVYGCGFEFIPVDS